LFITGEPRTVITRCYGERWLPASRSSSKERLMPMGDTGYVYGVFDLLTLEHLAWLDQASARCGRIVFGVATDELAERCGGQAPIVSEGERLEIVSTLRGVDSAVLLRSEDLPGAVRSAGATVVFAWPDTDDAVQRAIDPGTAFAGTGVQVLRSPASGRTSAPAVATTADRRDGSEVA
jgi:glycerol-3-phosphate cytidylyltransferase